MYDWGMIAQDKPRENPGGIIVQSLGKQESEELHTDTAVCLNNTQSKQFPSNKTLTRARTVRSWERNKTCIQTPGILVLL